MNYAYQRHPGTGGVFDFVGDAWDDIKSVVTNDTFWTLLGAYVTAGQAGWITGILSNVEQVALKEGMNALAGVAVPAITCLGRAGYLDVTEKDKQTEEYKRCVQVARDTNFLDAWKGQMAWRMKRAVELGGPAAVAEYAPVITRGAMALAKSVPFAKNAVDAYVFGRRVYDDARTAGKNAEEAVAAGKKATLDKLEETCKLQNPLTEGAAYQAQACRPDVLALGANYHLGEAYFDVSDWDPVTGRPYTAAQFLPNDTSRPFTIAELEKAFRNVTRAGAGVPKAVVLEVEKMLVKAYEGRQRLIDAGIKPNPDTTANFTPIALYKTPSGEITATPPPPPVAVQSSVGDTVYVLSKDLYPTNVVPGISRDPAKLEALWIRVEAADGENIKGRINGYRYDGLDYNVEALPEQQVRTAFFPQSLARARIAGPEVKRGVLEQLFRASVYTSPIWGGYLLGTWLRKRRHK